MSYEPKRADFSVPVRINLYSDTQTRPSRAMMEAMMAAEVGDEQGGSDPTVWELCDRTAALLRKEAAMFMPSGTMCNQVAVATHCRPGDEILAHEDAHIQGSEGGAPGAISGVMIRGLQGPRGMFSAETVREAIRPVSRYSPPQRLLEVEQTANKGGGACWRVEELQAVATIAHEHGMHVHMDGARVMNAAVALGVPVGDVVAACDTVMLEQLRDVQRARDRPLRHDIGVGAVVDCFVILVRSDDAADVALAVRFRHGAAGPEPSRFKNDLRAGVAQERLIRALALQYRHTA